MDLLNPATWGPWLMAAFAGLLMLAGSRGMKGANNRGVLLIAMCGFWFSLAAAPIGSYGTVGSKGFELFSAVVGAVFSAIGTLITAITSSL